MQVQLIHRLVHSEGNIHIPYEPGDVYNTSDADAELLIAQGSAVRIEDNEPSPAPTPKAKRA